MKPGTPLHVAVGTDTFPLVSQAILDARGACAEILAGYLLQAKFRRWGGAAPDTEFSLEAVNREWPDSSAQFRTPCATILDDGTQAYAEHSLVPTALEETLHRFGPNTVLWKTGEAECRFQVDFWEVDRGSREAVSAALPAMFNPREDQAGLYLSGDPRYYCMPMRAVLSTYQRSDNEGSAWASQRRLTVGIECTIDVVHLRCANVLVPIVQVDVADTEET